jgi:squalene-associated FAD-dependent desaturase
MPKRVVIVGGGLAGLAAATALAPRGFEVTLLESRSRLGGRASSFVDATTGQLTDACQHVSMGCCTNFAHFCREIGIADLLETQPCLYFMTPDRRVSRFVADRVPAPFHLARSFWNAPFLTLGEKLRIAAGLAALVRKPTPDDPPFQAWLDRHWQTPQTVRRFWGVVLTSALNETPDRIGLRYARKVFLDAFLRHRRGFEVELPRVPLGRLYGEELQNWLVKHQVKLRMNCAGKSIRASAGMVECLDLRDGDSVKADWYIAALPFDRLLSLLPANLIEVQPFFRNLQNLETSPITSVHLWYSQPAMDLPHVILVDCVGQWIFNRGQVDSGEHYIQVVVSASRQFRGLAHDDVERKIVAEISQLFPEARPEGLVRSRVVTEHAATFSAVPGVDEWRPKQESPIGNLFVAGDWTATGWPATMEGAVRSGYASAEAILNRVGRREVLIQPDL